MEPIALVIVFHCLVACCAPLKGIVTVHSISCNETEREVESKAESEKGFQQYVWTIVDGLMTAICMFSALSAARRFRSNHFFGGIQRFFALLSHGLSSFSLKSVGDD